MSGRAELGPSSVCLPTSVLTDGTVSEPQIEMLPLPSPPHALSRGICVFWGWTGQVSVLKCSPAVEGKGDTPVFPILPEPQLGALDPFSGGAAVETQAPVPAAWVRVPLHSPLPAA